MRITLLGYPCDNVDLPEVLAWLDGAMASDRTHMLTDVNAAKLVEAGHDELVARAILESDLVLADGMSVVWASRLLGRPLKGRLPGCDLFQHIVAYGSTRGYRFYLLGATDECVRRTRQALEARHPGVSIVGVHDGYFTGEEEGAIVQHIRDSGANVLFIGMPTPLKEHFIVHNCRQLPNIRYVQGVGGSFDVVAGLVPRAPVWMQDAGLEWFFRFLQEPRRMWRRYLTTNTAFAFLVLRDLLRIRRPEPPHSAPPPRAQSQ
jgi:N-acetylglucosaminyldiphosphoundecaprenol N-acetyl-beta-D-mannosaminyltransferase